MVSSANGSPRLDALEAQALREVFGTCGHVAIAAPKALSGEFDGSGILRLVLALSDLGRFPNPEAILGIRQPSRQGANDAGRLRNGLILLLGASAGGSRAALLLERQA